MKKKLLKKNKKQVTQDNEHIILRATADGMPEYIEQNINGVVYKAIKVADKIYIQDNTQTI